MPGCNQFYYQNVSLADQSLAGSTRTKHETRDGKPVIVRLPELDFINDKPGKPVAIQQHIGRRPLMAFGNSDGDFEMLELTTSGSGPRFAMIVHHNDAEREWAYDRKSPIGKLDKGLEEAPRRGWILVSMINVWKVIHLVD